MRLPRTSWYTPTPPCLSFATHVAAAAQYQPRNVISVIYANKNARITAEVCLLIATRSNNKAGEGGRRPSRTRQIETGAGTQTPAGCSLSPALHTEPTAYRVSSRREKLERLEADGALCECLLGASLYELDDLAVRLRRHGFEFGGPPVDG